jgi:hypothetical protein
MGVHDGAIYVLIVVGFDLFSYLVKADIVKLVTTYHPWM